MTQTAEHPNLTRARDLCLSFLDSIEDDRDGHPTFRVREKAFASIVPGKDERFSLLMQAAAGEQDSLLAEGPPFFLPRRGPKGWIGIALDDDPLRVPDGHDLLRQERNHKNWTLEENKPSNYKGPQYKSLNTVATSTKMI